ncbi:barstar family protein [Burkholderiaceae bacterium FT117]|uniref:barstar family protein n=1 Tax=Zeimonas sediminis TaxID=2944268 RepID=UPI002342DD2F|nr:barstar family protein [Zeimonas sediminis]MCM5570244.1 barstar family protein [Zeimonas sediminis]
MGALSNIPPHAVLPLGAYDGDSLKRAAERADQRLLAVDLARARDRDEVMEAIAGAFLLPDYFGRNLDALYDCITDLKPLDGADQPGFLVILENLPDTAQFSREQRDALLDVFRDAADFFYDRDTAFRVFYSVDKPGS